MLRKDKITKLLMVFVLLFVTSISTNAQEVKSKKQLRMEARQVRKSEKAKIQNARLDSLKEIIKERAFVIEANSIHDRNSFKNTIDPNTFMKIKDHTIFVQTAHPVFFGENGLGGVTVEGRITDYNIVESKNGIKVNMRVTSTLWGQTTIYLSVDARGKTDVLIRDNSGNRTNIAGDLVSLDNSRVFLGTSVF